MLLSKVLHHQNKHSLKCQDFAILNQKINKNENWTEKSLSFAKLRHSIVC